MNNVLQNGEERDPLSAVAGIDERFHAARLARQHRSDASPFMVGQFIAHDSKLPVLKLESQGCDRSQYGLDSLRPGLKSAFRGEADMNRQAISVASVENDPTPT